MISSSVSNDYAIFQAKLCSFGLFLASQYGLKKMCTEYYNFKQRLSNRNVPYTYSAVTAYTRSDFYKLTVHVISEYQYCC